MKFGLCLEMVFDHDDIPTRIRKAADLGFSCAEIWFVDGTYQGTPEELSRIARQAGVTITNTVIGAPDGSLGGGLTDPRRRQQWLERARLTLDFNQRAGIAATIVCTGNGVDGLTHQQMQDSVVEGLKPTLEAAEKAGVTLLLEPLNTPYDHPGYFMASSRAGLDICRRFNSPHLKLLFDCYHMQIMEGDLTNRIKAGLDAIGHFHAAGVPGRHEPYLGETNYPFLIDQIQKAGYQGVFALEYMPSLPDHAQSLQRSLAYLQANPAT